MKTTLVTVVHGDQYEKWTEDLFSSADEFFCPTDEVDFLMLPGEPGWPDATMMRPQVLNDHFPDADYVFLCDADMVFEGHVGGEIIRLGLTATAHPGYVGMGSEMLPYERRGESAVRIPFGEGKQYFAGGFWGGEARFMKNACQDIARLIRQDGRAGIIPIWHDESALNHHLALVRPPALILTPAYCYPDNDSYYKTFWPEQYERKLVALDKTSEQRVGR